MGGQCLQMGDMSHIVAKELRLGAAILQRLTRQSVIILMKRQHEEGWTIDTTKEQTRAVQLPDELLLYIWSTHGRIHRAALSAVDLAETDRPAEDIGFQSR